MSINTESSQKPAYYLSDPGQTEQCHNGRRAANNHKGLPLAP